METKKREMEKKGEEKGIGKEGEEEEEEEERRRKKKKEEEEEEREKERRRRRKRERKIRKKKEKREKIVYRFSVQNLTNLTNKHKGNEYRILQ